MMTSQTDRGIESLERLSTVIDGEADADAVVNLCRAWTVDHALRRHWHAYHLIGDALRSDELVTRSGCDDNFLATFRERLGHEPILMVPEAARANEAPGTPARRGRWRSWSAPGAAAAGFVAVAGVMWSGQGWFDSSGEPAFVAARTSVPMAATTVAALPMPAAAVVRDAADDVASPAIVRDARLQQYLAAHNQFGGSTALGATNGFLRNVTAQVSER